MPQALIDVVYITSDMSVSSDSVRAVTCSHAALQEGTEAEKAQNFTDLVLKQLSRPSDKRVFAIWEAFKVCGVPDPQHLVVWQVIACEEAGCCVLGPRKKRVAFQRMNLKSRSVTRTFCSMSICKALWRGQAIPPRHGGRAEDADAPHCYQPHVWLSM